MASKDEIDQAIDMKMFPGASEADPVEEAEAQQIAALQTAINPDTPSVPSDTGTQPPKGTDDQNHQ